MDDNVLDGGEVEVWSGDPKRQVSLVQLMDKDGTDIVHIGDGYMIVVEAPQHFFRPDPPAKEFADPDTVDLNLFTELGRTGMGGYNSYMREEYNSLLRDRQGLIQYDRMRRQDAAVRSSLRTLKTPIIGATWYIQPFDDKKRSKTISEFVTRNLTQWMTYSWTQVLWEALLMLDFGYYMFEKVYDIRIYKGQPRVYWKKLACRHPLDVESWNFDANGGPNSVVMYGANNKPVVIPIEKLAIFTYDGEGGDLRGMSVLRSAYKHWYFKENLYKIDAIQKERHGIGIPIIKLAPGFKDQDVIKANEMGANLRTNERAHVVLPPNWEILFAKLEGQPVDALASAKHHTEQIYQNVLAQAVYASAEGDAQSMMELFYKSTRYIADLVRGVINKYCIPYLVQANWGIEDYPELRVRRLGDTQEARTISFALRNLVGAGVVRVDDPLEEWAREIMDAPRSDPTTRREVATPQQPGEAKPARVGAPRQAQAANQRPMPGQRAGQDQSGGA